MRNAGDHLATAFDVDVIDDAIGGMGSPLGFVATFLCCGFQKFRDFLFRFIIGKFDSVVRFAPGGRAAALFVFCGSVRPCLKKPFHTLDVAMQNGPV
jgi:hypothetical protein